MNPRRSVQSVWRRLAGGLHAPGVPAPGPGKPRPGPTVVERITLRGTPGEPEAIGPVSSYSGERPWISVESLGLGEPLAEVMAKDAAPLPSTVDREHYHGDRHLDFWLAGLRDYLGLRRVLARHGMDLAPGPARRVLDFGCASGRVLRHVLFQSPLVEAWGADINERNIDWMRRFLPPTLRVFQSTALPHLPLEDGSFDVVYGFSVFTHIDRLEAAWLLELRRLLRPGGILYLSFHSDAVWSRMGPDIPLYNALLRRAGEIRERVPTAEMFRAPMPRERIAFTYRGQDVYHCNVFHARAYVEREWGRFFTVEEIVDRGADWHDVAVLRK